MELGLVMELGLEMELDRVVMALDRGVAVLASLVWEEETLQEQYLSRT